MNEHTTQTVEGVAEKGVLESFLASIMGLFSFRLQAKKTDLSDSQAVRSLVGFIGDLLGAVAKYTPTKIDDQIAVQLKAGTDSDDAWAFIWKIIERFRVAPGVIVNDENPLTPEICQEYAAPCIPAGSEKAGPQNGVVFGAAHPEAIPTAAILAIARIVIGILQKLQS